ncbi:MAG TPA: hypothetical protein VEF72_12075 [Mycobacterium sp.]|nr:hypothetical protein [Mycobacterium sp.]
MTTQTTPTPAPAMTLVPDVERLRQLVWDYWGSGLTIADVFTVGRRQHDGSYRMLGTREDIGWLASLIRQGR